MRRGQPEQGNLKWTTGVYSNIIARHLNEDIDINDQKHTRP